ncbi:MAG TPA: DNA polymerase IV [Candidatus Paceibacterota bacterium]|nr:DNA polymerase IV [Candidatus Paceibacterota bacterium]
MCHSPLLLSSFPRAVLHIDGDAFFASCEQARDPALKGRPVITGLERGIAASMSYEAKARGITRAMPLWQIRRICPDAVILPSDYETYSLLSKRLFDIVRRWTPDVEEYGVDECFADITGLRRMHRASYPVIASRIQRDLAAELGFTFSIGLAPTKVLAKIGSKWKKPNGLTAIPGRRIHEYLANLPVENVWGIGPQTTAFLMKHRIRTALEFARLPLEWVFANTTKPFQEIWQELNGLSVLQLVTEAKTTYASIQKFKTFTPPSTDAAFVFSQLSRNIENACIKVRRYDLAVREAVFLLRTQQFDHAGIEVELSDATPVPGPIIAAAREAFRTLWKPGTQYRATGVVFTKLESDDRRQPDLFGAHVGIERSRRVYQSADALDAKYGKHTVYVATSHIAQTHAQHDSERGHLAARKTDLVRGETGRQRLAIPMLMGREFTDQAA